MRTTEGYNQNAEEVEKDPSFSGAYGIMSRSPFNSGSFHVVHYLPPEFMHDLLEGIVPFKVASVVNAPRDKNFFISSSVNRIIKTWNYESLDKLDKPDKPVSMQHTYSLTTHHFKAKCSKNLLSFEIAAINVKRQCAKG